MNTREAVAVVALFQGAWGHVEVNERTMAVWNDVLREIPAEDGAELARKLVRESTHFPAPSEFYGAWKTHRRFALERAKFAERALPSGNSTLHDEALVHVERLRAELAAAKQRHASSKARK